MFSSSSIEGEIERIVRRVLSEATATEGTFSTNALPPDVKTRVRFHALVRHVPGARKVGRTWVVSADAWRTWRASGGTSATVNVDPDAPEAVAARMLGQGFRHG
jgi:hypothetical protein